MIMGGCASTRILQGSEVLNFAENVWTQMTQIKQICTDYFWIVETGCTPSQIRGYARPRAYGKEAKFWTSRKVWTQTTQKTQICTDFFVIWRYARPAHTQGSEVLNFAENYHPESTNRTSLFTGCYKFSISACDRPVYFTITSNGKPSAFILLAISRVFWRSPSALLIFIKRECVVFKKGESERVVYFDARTKIHLIEYLQSRIRWKSCKLFVSLNSPYERLGISGVETRLKELGKKCNINKIHPHKFRRTMATNAIDKGMPIEQVQKLLGHVQIDTTMQYAIVNQSNVKLAHRKFIG